MLVKINGKLIDILSGSTIQDIMIVKNLSKEFVIVDLNGSILNPEHWSSTHLHPDDDIEVIEIIGGG